MKLETNAQATATQHFVTLKFSDGRPSIAGMLKVVLRFA
jgi:hypothetical protein